MLVGLVFFAAWPCVCCFVLESITPQARGYMSLDSAVSPHTLSACGQFYRGAVFSTWRPCGGNIVVCFCGIFREADTGLSGLSHHLIPSSSFTSLSLYA